MDRTAGQDIVYVVTTRDTQFQVDFKFSCDFFVREYYDNVILGHLVYRSLMRTSVRMDMKQLMKSQSPSRLINQVLRDWPMADEQRRDLSEFAINTAKDLIRLMPPQHHVLVIPFPVEITCHLPVDENRAMELMHRRSTEEDDHSSMVPATDSSIESLEIKTTTACEDDEICSIYLEDFYGGCEVLSMPCSHYFYEDCIKKWLKSSHSCPICRFELPTGHC